MKRLHSFVIKSYIGPFIITFFITIFLLLMQFLWKYIDDLVGKGLAIGIISELMFYASITLIPMALPLAILLSSIMTFGNLGEHNELMALKASGISLFRIMLPTIVITFFISIAAFFFSNNVMPYANLKMGSLLYDVRHQSPEVSIKEGIFNNSLEGYSIKISHKNKKTGMLYNLMIYNHTEGEGNREVTRADSATIKITNDNRYMILTMYSGISYNELLEKRKRRSEKEYPHRLDKFKEERVLIDMSGLGFERTDENLFKSHYQMLNLSQLKYTVDSLDSIFEKRVDDFENRLIISNYLKHMDNGKKDSLWSLNKKIPTKSLAIDSLLNSYSKETKLQVYITALDDIRSTKSYIESSESELTNRKGWIKRHEIEWHRKFTLSFACIILFFIGAPLGAIIRKGGLGMPVIISVLFFILYYVISISGEKSAKIGTWSSWLGMWISSISLFPLGIFLTYKAVNESVILNTDIYIKAFQKLLFLKKYIKKPLKREKNV